MTTVLLVEDNQLNREMFARRLERKGFRVLSAADGREAVNKAVTELPDLVLMDLSLPIMDGWEATRKLKANRETSGIPVIAMTAHAMAGDREKALEAGCDDYETKPVDLPRLMTKIQTLLSRSGVDLEFAASEVHGKSQVAVASETRRRAPASPSVQHRPASQSPSGQAYVLVVDDNQLNRDMLSRRLEREGYHVTLARDGNEAIALIARHTFDLVLLDMMMPEVNGLDVLGVIRESHSLVDLPVIIVTAKDQSEDMVAALKYGANDYITKPFNFPVLLARMSTQLQVKRNRHPVAAPSRGEPPARPASRPGYAAPDSDTRHGAAATATLLDAQTDHGTRSGSSNSGDRLFRRTSAPSSHEPRPGQLASLPSETATVAGYEILSKLGQGGMGVVYKARHRRMNRLVALKVINKEHLISSHTIQRFYREIQAAAQLQHANIVMAFDAGEFGDTHYFAMEYIEGVDLNKLVRERGPLPVSHACAFVAQAARGLQHASERGLVHRDVKPSNLLVAGGQFGDALPAPEHSTVKLLDLGLALLYDPTEPTEASGGLTRDGRVVGTADYMAPEQWMNAHKVDIRADLYALGGTFYFLLTGQVPFPSAEPMEKMLKHHLDEPIPVERQRPGLPGLVVSTVRKLMAKKPEHRFQQPAEVAEVLKPLLLG